MRTPDTVPAPAGDQWPVIGQLGLGALSLIVANSGVLCIFFALDVTLFQLVLVYWCECAWIGIFSAIKLITASMIGDPYENRWADVSPGVAVFVSLCVIVFSSSAFFSLLGTIFILILFANESLALSTPNDKLLNHIALVLGASSLLMAAHATSLVSNFLLLGEFRAARVRELVALPFRRCPALLAAILVSIALVVAVPEFASTTGFAVAVILLKLLWDIRLHLEERRIFAASRAERGSA